MAARRLGPLAVRPAAIARGLVEAGWQARLQRLEQGTLAALVGRHHELWLDGGHNPAAGLALAASLPDLARGRPVRLVVGMLQTKDVASFLRPLLPLAAGLLAVPVPNEPAGRDPAEIAALARAAGVPAAALADVPGALARLAAEPAASLVLICGSLYLAGDVLRANG
jgi:dihydrofolate synthase/folylpolyglutamate synthase